MTNKEVCFHYLTETAALSRAVAIGIMANIMHESNFKPNVTGDNGTSYGLCQWHKSRWDRLKDYCNDHGLNIKEVKSQLQYLLWEFRKYYGSAWDDISEQPNTQEGAEEVAYIMCVKFEIPANKEQSGKKRSKTAAALWEEFSTEESGKVNNSLWETPTEDNRIRYRVQTGDNLTKIARAHGVTVADIVMANPVRYNLDLLNAGEILYIPRD